MNVGGRIWGPLCELVQRDRLDFELKTVCLAAVGEMPRSFVVTLEKGLFTGVARGGQVHRGDVLEFVERHVVHELAAQILNRFEGVDVPYRSDQPREQEGVNAAVRANVVHHSTGLDDLGHQSLSVRFPSAVQRRESQFANMRYRSPRPGRNRMVCTDPGRYSVLLRTGLARPST